MLILEDDGHGLRSIMEDIEEAKQIIFWLKNFQISNVGL
jgi:hypothetical protein